MSGSKSQTSARYTIRHGGVIVSTGLGSTGWLKILLAGADAIAARAGSMQAAGAAALPPTAPPPWDTDYLYFTVREPFPSPSSAASLVFGKITGASCLALTSQMAENGVIFSDGIEADFLEFNSGIVARLGPVEKKGLLVV